MTHALEAFVKKDTKLKMKERTNKNGVEKKESNIFESRIHFLSLEMQNVTSDMRRK